MNVRHVRPHQLQTALASDTFGERLADAVRNTADSGHFSGFSVYLDRKAANMVCTELCYGTASTLRMDPWKGLSEEQMHDTLGDRLFDSVRLIMCPEARGMAETVYADLVYLAGSSERHWPVYAAGIPESDGMHASLLLAQRNCTRKGFTHHRTGPARDVYAALKEHEDDDSLAVIAGALQATGVLTAAVVGFTLKRRGVGIAMARNFDSCSQRFRSILVSR